LDANIFVSAFIWGGKPRLITNRYVQMVDMLFISGEIIDEIRYVLRMPKFDLSKRRFDDIIENIETHGRMVNIISKHRVTGVCRDPYDDMYLECAIAAGADYIISGDRDLLDLKEYGGVKIVSAREYLDIVGG
jgi:putative PIN family toxin of toxin-antitoxin system